VIVRVSTKGEVRSAVEAAKREGKTVGFVPTMGALHEGHLSLVRAASRRCDVVAVSVFVNPTQFSPGEDFERYPRQIETDLELLASAGADLVWTPTTEEMYAPDAEVTVDPGPLATRWEGAVRPGHFAGMATIVTKLLSVVRPDAAFFGEKDYQQLVIVRSMVRDLDLGCEVAGCPIVRDPDGLALSSRNAYLSAEGREAGLGLAHALWAAATGLMQGERDARVLESAMREAAALHAGDALDLDYAAVVDPETLEPLARIEGPARAIIAGRVGTTRLLDNLALTPLPEGS
jgi:pantoate--beta-alanine ligase